MRPRLFKDLLEKYRKGETQPAETKLVDDWYDSFGKEFPVQDLRRKKELRNEVHGSIRQRLTQDTAPKIKSMYPYLWPKIAAALFILGMGVWHSVNRKNTWQSSQEKWITVSADSGKLKKVQLPDSTTVWLNAGAKLAFATPFGQNGQRLVKLEEGEAFFDVTPNARQPFSVHSGELHIRVLGTSFNVKAYNELDELQVDVLSGKVEVSSKDSHNLGILQRGDELTYNKLSRAIDIQKVATESSNDWITGSPYLRRATFKELAVTFRRTHGVNLRAGNDAVLAQRYSMPLSRDLLSDELIKVICEVHNNQYRKEGDTIIIF